MKKHASLSSLTATVLLFALSFGSAIAIADDTEIFINRNNLSPEQVRPNVVFVLDTSGSMGLPVEEFGTTARRELRNYDRNRTYTASVNTNGGPGDNDYYYLYRRADDAFANHYVYFNKVHTSQLNCGAVNLNRFNPFTNRSRRFFYNSPASNRTPMCDENDNSCAFTAAPGGPQVSCPFRSQNTTPNLFVANANFHNYLQSYYRYAVLQTVVKDLIDKPFDINLSLMKFNNGQGGVVIKESVDANLVNNQSDLKSVINRMEFDGVTPLTETLWEAANYLRGEPATYGGTSNERARAAFVNDSNVYDSPIDYACQRSYIILLTDGEPTSDDDRDRAISDLTGSNCSHFDNARTPARSCLDNYATWLRKDNSATPATLRDHSQDLIDIQEIVVHTIGFGLDSPLLATTAANADGVYKTASTSGQLSAAIAAAFDQAQFGKDTFVAPAIAVNSYTGLQHRNELYFALFQPGATPRWSGNLKKYTLDGDIIRDQNGNPAIDNETGYIVDSALSFWTIPLDLDNDGNVDFTTDGGDVSIGGFATQLTDPTARTIYTYTGTDSPTNLALTERLDINNAAITTDLLGVNDAADPIAERINVINWARGGVTDTPPPNYFVSDIIHNRPSVVTYRTIRPSDPNGVPTFDDTVFVASNMGFFHAVDADNGSEEFAFVPKELLGNLTTYYRDTGSFTDKVYGLDAPMAIWRFDENNDGSIITANGTADGNDFAYIYQGMRRGGSSLYALDVTLRSNPRLLWQIDGTAYNDTPIGDFRNLAQTWSVPQRGKIKWNCSNGNCTDRNVLFFGGGYDTDYDDTATSPNTTSRGNALYMVDAVTGELLWSAGNSARHNLRFGNMNSSIPADVTVGDINNDGYMDFMFAVDIRGGLWRIDFADEPTGAGDFATGGMIADLGGGGNNFRRFFNAPDVAYFSRRGIAPFLSISVTSGYRARPRNTDVNDFLFVVFDTNVTQPPTNNNYNYVNNSGVIGFADLGTAPVSTQYGWKLPFTTVGEKGLSRTATFGDRIIFTTYVPESVSTCEGSTGIGRRYVLDALTGRSTLTLDGDIVPYQTLKNGGIPPEPVVLYTTVKKCVSGCDGPNPVYQELLDNSVCVGTECMRDLVEQRWFKTFWREN